jgi:SAM-dependent methyltransferase
MISLQTDLDRYFKQQYDTTTEYIIPFIGKDSYKGLRFLEIGSGYGGICKAFADVGCQVTGIELLKHATEIANTFLKEEIASGKIKLINQNVYDIDWTKMNADELYDIILLKDTIEHIHGQEKFIKHIVHFLKPGGILFFAFPPWNMPYGGHQQGLSSKVLDKLPYFHILPTPIYKGILKLFGEVEGRIADTLEVKETQISINRFERIIKRNGLNIQKRQFYLINPSYKHKFGLTPRKQSSLLSGIPYLRDFFTTTCYYVIQKPQ